MALEPFQAGWGGPPGPRPTPSSACSGGQSAGPGGPARTRASAPHLALLIFVSLLASCRHQPQVYLLKQEGRTQLLTPPASKPEIKKARSHPAQKTGCDVEAESFSVAWHGNTARVAAKTEAYYAPPPAAVPSGPPGVSIAETGPRVFVDSLAQLENFRDALAAREEAGCFKDDEGAHLRQSIAETFTFPPQVAAFLRFGTYLRTGYIDLMPGFVMRLVSPSGSDPEVSFYEVKGVPGNDRVQIALASGAGKALTVPETPAYFRYLYWSGGWTHSFRTTILGVPERAMLRDATEQFLADPERYCTKPGVGIFCQSIAVSVGMNAGFYVRVDGKDTFVRLGGQVGEALGEARNGMRLVRGAQPAPQNVAVRRMFHGKLIPIKVDGSAGILSLVAMPGDEITAAQ
ncbi:MAG TPA: hypothetical protein VK752_08690 [Bryobacteraceae bacterium]|jgi:hypothetical protein|nr:hypothetical protein [Bryobacteraceae bacterium]